jgi:SOS-response transcriptional repressor LexA
MNDDTMSALRIIDEHIKLFGFPPTQRDIADNLGLQSSSGGAKMVRRLEAAGLIEVTPRRSRGVRITRSGMKALTEGL